MNERIKKLRKALDLTQQEFASRIGSVQNTITGYETGRRVPSNQVLSLICREFNVSEEWLRTGEGEMFIAREEDPLSELVRQRGLSVPERILVEKFLDLKPESRRAVIDYMEKIVSALSQSQPEAAPEPDPMDDIERQVEDYRRRLILEKRQAGEPSPLSADDATA